MQELMDSINIIFSCYFCGTRNSREYCTDDPIGYKRFLQLRCTANKKYMAGKSHAN